MDSEGDTSGTEDEVRWSETGHGSISSTEESTGDSDYDGNEAFLEQNHEKDVNTENWTGRTKENFEDKGSEQYLRDENSMGEHLDAIDVMDDDCEY